MASLATVLCPQNTNQKEQARVLKLQELNKVSDHLKPKLHTAQSSKNGAENQDPNGSKPVKVGSKLLGVSRLPVLAKSLQPIVLNSSQNPGHKKWQEKPLLGKAQKRKTCTKPVPFNFSQSRVRNQKRPEASAETANISGMPSTCSSQLSLGKTTAAITKSTASVIMRSENTHSAKAITVPLNLQSHTVVVSKTNMHKDTICNEPASFIQRDLSTKLGSVTIVDSEVTQHSGQASETTRPESRAVQPNTKGCIRDLRSANCATENTVPFSSDPSALLSILLNKGITVRHPGEFTPRASTCPSGRGTSIYSAQRVPIRKPRTQAFSPDPSALHHNGINDSVKVGAMTPSRVLVCPSRSKTPIYSAQRVPIKKVPLEAALSGAAVPFSPDPTALRSILLNEGVKVGGTTPRVSTCPSRKTSIYSAQRVPVKKAWAEKPARCGVSQTPTIKSTSQRFPCPQSQSVRRLNSTYKKLHVNSCPGSGEAQHPSADSCTEQEEDVVLKLFQEDPEHEEDEKQDNVTPDQALQHDQYAESHMVQLLNGDTETHQLGNHSKDPAAQPFIQAPHRQSVIVFSSGQKPAANIGARAPVIQMSQHAEQLELCAALSTIVVPSIQTSGSQRKLKSDQSNLISSGGLFKTKAVCSLRRHLPALEVMFLDEECAMYTSCQQSWPAQPRCTNPVASALLFQDSTCFVPISWTSLSLSPVSHPSSSIRTL